jgi:hypothetical protein
VNNAVARVAGLLSIAVLPLIAGLSGEAYTNPALLDAAYRTAMWICSGLLVVGGVLSALFVRTPIVAAAAGHDDDDDGRAHRLNCPVDGPPIDRCPRHGHIPVAGEAS